MYYIRIGINIFAPGGPGATCGARTPGGAPRKANCEPNVYEYLLLLIH